MYPKYNIRSFGYSQTLHRCQTSQIFPRLNLENIFWIENYQTATHLAVNVKGNVLFGIGCIGKITEQITPNKIRERERIIANADLLLIDANVTVETLKTAVEMAHSFGTKVWFEPTDLRKVGRVFDAAVSKLISIISPNIKEFAEYCRRMEISLPDEFTETWGTDTIMEYLLKHAELYLSSLTDLILTMGSRGTVIISKGDGNAKGYTLPPPLQPDQIISVSGAGDCLNSGLIAGRLYGLSEQGTMRIAQNCAAQSLRSKNAVPEALSSLIPILHELKTAA